VVWAGENRAKSPVHPHKDATGCIRVSEKTSSRKVRSGPGEARVYPSPPNLVVPPIILICPDSAFAD
jgi:hypothetical protein